jgi:hypothetical protein
MGVEEMREEDSAVEKAYDWLEGLFRRPAMRESGKVTLDGLGLEGGWRCLMEMEDDWIREWRKGR